MNCLFVILSFNFDDFCLDWIAASFVCCCRVGFAKTCLATRILKSASGRPTPTRYLSNSPNSDLINKTIYHLKFVNRITFIVHTCRMVASAEIQVHSKQVYHKFRAQVATKLNLLPIKAGFGCVVYLAIRLDTIIRTRTKRERAIIP